MLPRGGLGDFNSRQGRGQQGWNDAAAMGVGIGGGVSLPGPGMVGHFQGAPIVGVGNFPGNVPNMDMGNQAGFLDGGGLAGNYGGGIVGGGIPASFGPVPVSGFGVGSLGFPGGNGNGIFPGANFGGGAAWLKFRFIYAACCRSINPQSYCRLPGR